MRTSVAGSVCFALLVCGCGGEPPVQARLPPITPDVISARESDRKYFYHDWRLRQIEGGTKWARNESGIEGRYGAESLKDVTAPFPPAAALYGQAQARLTTFEVLSTIGLAAAGGLLGWELATKGPPTTGDWAAIGTVLAFDIGLIVMIVSWKDPLKGQLETTYNRALREKLQIR